MRKIKFVLFVLLIFQLASLSVGAQLITNENILRKASKIMASKEKDDFAKLITLSRLKGWPLVIKGKNGRRAMLVGVDAKGYPLYTGVYDVNAASTIKTNQLWPGGSSGLNLSGSSSSVKGKMAIWDEGIVRASHVELGGRVIQKDNPSSISDHSTHVAGDLIASGVNPSAKGMAFGDQQILAYDFNNHLSEMLAESPNLLISNHSYGSIAGWNFNTDSNRWEFWGNSGDTVDYKFGYYSSEAQVWDSIAYNAPFYLIVKSVGNNRSENGPAVGQPYYRFNSSGVMASAGNRPAGISFNNGYDIIPSYGNAKNILTVGAVFPIAGGYTQPSDVVLTNFSSWGPTDDGRIKPDVVASGIADFSCIGTSDNAYAYYDGSSFSSPAAAGSSLLLQEYYAKLHGGAFMRSATLKGILIHTADEAGPSPGPDYQYGWGLINMQNAASVITSQNTDQLIFENNLVNGNSFSVPITASGKGPLIATISWTDPKGNVANVGTINSPVPKLVNDLDLRITNGATTYLPWILDPKNRAAAATTGDNTLDNIEKIVINNAIPGQIYTINVSHKGTLVRGQQAYSLLVSGAGGQVYCTSGPTSSSGTRIDSVSIGSFQNANPSACTSYTNYTNLAAQIQPSQTVPFSIKVSNCDVNSNPKIVKIYIDYNNNGNFTDPGEEVAQSGVIPGAGGVFSGSFTSPAGLTTGFSTLLRVVAEETNNPLNVTPCGSYGFGETEDYRVQIVKPSNDVGVTQLIDPFGTVCSNDSQRITIRIRNFGTFPQVHVPVTTTVKNGNTIIATLTVSCPDTIPALGDVIYTYQAAFAALAGNTYTITSTTNLSGDQDTTNDQFTTMIVVSTGSNPPTGSAEICSTNPNLVSLRANLTDSNDAAIWYDSPTATVPIAGGSKTSTTIIPPSKTYYLALNDLNSKVGPPNKMVFSSGGYNAFFGNFVTFTNNVPLTIQSARLYIGTPGKITFIVADIVNFNRSTGSYSYFPISTSTINVYATTPTAPILGNDINNPADTGAVFFLGLSVPTPGDHAIIIECQDGASIFRNNNISPNPYPFSIRGVFSITGNSAVNMADTTDRTFFEKYYYFFYNMSLQFANCPSPRVAVAASTAIPPQISLTGNVLSSNIAIGNQWYLNDTAIAGATAQTDTAVRFGTYKDVVTDSLGCAISSNKIVYTAGGTGDISLLVSPNPNNGLFTVQFSVSSTADVHLSILNTLGQRIYASAYPNFSGIFSQQIYAGNVSAGMYVLKIQVGNKYYIKKLIINN